MRQHKSYSFINIFGLAVAMACCILIALYARTELQYDQFHEKADRITSVGVEYKFFGRMLSTPHPLADAMVEEMPAVEQATRVVSASNLKLSRSEQDFVEIGDGKYAEPSFFDVFSFELIRGKAGQALNSPNSIVLTESAKEKLFNNTQNPVGQTLYWQKADSAHMLTVKGIVKDPPTESSIQFEGLISYNTRPASQRKPEAWMMFNVETYGLLKPEASFSSLDLQFKSLAETLYDSEDEEALKNRFFYVPLTEYHLSEESGSKGFTGSKTYLYLFGSVALFILVIACVNYINLATAKTSMRTREVGVRKTLGGNRGQIVGQFLGESVLLSVVSYIIGVGIAQLVLPHFNQLFGTSIAWQANEFFLLGLLGAAVLVGLLAGLYPALYLSGFNPISVIRSKAGNGPSGSILRKSLVVGQFALATILIISALVVYKQLDYTQTKDLGFNDEQVAVIDLPNSKSWDLRESIADKVQTLAGVQGVSTANHAPGGFSTRMGQTPDNLSAQHKVESDESIMFAPAIVDHYYLPLLDINLLAGRNFSPDLSTDRENAYIINKKAAEKLGWSVKEAVGKPFGLSKEGKVIGVVENFHITSLKSKIEPVSLQMFEGSYRSSGGKLIVRLAPDKISSALDMIKNELANYASYSKFEYEFLDQVFDSMYRTEQRLAQIVSLFTIVAIIIACLGLYGLSAFAAERRTKEIGIRKAVGASVANIVMLLSKDFLKLVGLGFAIAIPLAWYAMNQWLDNFVYKIDLGAQVFIMAGFLALIIAITTVSWQSIRVALTNPVKSLQSE
ncbi:FtsX-like permease family protein [Aliifodinibius halophilus]|uniref:FtsX-like permease family protein n=1 Tax=Fodinibius halophilus TaxID=1736908 RepID=A0A6M1T5R9_9BACT|nr:FtsX-like permease family protein [Fodinibius halophilus]